MNQQEVVSLKTLKDQFNRFKSEFEKGQEPIQVLEEIYLTLHSIVEDPQTQLHQNSQEVQKFFFDEYVGGLTKRITQTRTSTNEEYLDYIKRLYHLLGDLFLYEMDLQNGDMADAMRIMFDLNTPTHQNNFQVVEQHHSSYQSEIESIFEKLPEEEKEWRLQLKEGSKIDAIKIENDSNDYQLKQWSKAVITNMIGNGSYFMVTFDHELCRSNRDFPIYSSEIAQFNTMSSDDEWREDLKIGDNVDAFDSTKLWYSSTIVDKEVREIDNKIVPYLKVGFRQYSPEGNKIEQHTGEKYFGWSDNFDEWLTAYNPRIQKFQHFAKVWDQSLQQTTQFDEACDDSMDQLLYPNKDLNHEVVYAIERKKFKSQLMINFINQFGRKGGFDTILDQILQQDNNEQQTIGLDLLFYYIDCIANCSQILNRTFFQSYYNKLYNAVRNKIINASEQQLKQVKRDRMDQIINLLVNTLGQRFKTYKQREQEKTLLSLEIGSTFLQKNFMERRIDGVKLVHEVCKGINYVQQSQSQDSILNNSIKLQQNVFHAKLIKIIKDVGVLHQIFSKERIHLELVQRTEELLKLLMSHGALSDEELELVWSKEEIELVHEMARRTQKVELATMAVDYLLKIAMESNEYIQQYLQPYSKIDKSLVNHAALSFSDIIKYWNIDNKMPYIDKLLQNLVQVFDQDNQNQQKGTDDLANVDLYGKTGDQQDNQERPLDKEQDQFNKDQQPKQLYDENGNCIDNLIEVEDKQSNSSLLDYVNQKQDILQAFFQNFKNYMQRARGVLQKKMEENPALEISSMADKCLTDKFMHSDQITERMEFLKFIAGNSNTIKVDEEMLNILWDELVVLSLIHNDQELFYKWLREVCDLHTQSCQIVEAPVLIQFFKAKMSKTRRAFDYISVEGFNCLQSLFILLNEQEKKVVRLGAQAAASDCIRNNFQRKQGNKLTSFSNVTGAAFSNFSFNQNKAQNVPDPDETEISVLVHPDELEGIDVLWRIAITTSDKKVQEKASTFLVKLHTRVAYRNEERVTEFEDCFIKKCVHGIQEMLSNINARKKEEVKEDPNKQITSSYQISSSVQQKALPQEEKNIIKYMSLIRNLIKSSEKEGNYGVKPHSALFKGEFLHTIQVNNSLKNGPEYLQKIEISCYSNTTLWELRKMVGEKAARAYRNSNATIYQQQQPVHPAAVRLYRYIGATDLKDYDNGKTLAELKFKPNEQLSAFKSNIYQSIKEPLLNEYHDGLSDRAKKIVIDWFNEYSVDEEIEDDDGQIILRRVMNPKTCAEFARSCTDDYCTEEDNRVVNLFIQYDHDRDNKILLDDFLEFFKNSAQEKEDIVRQNLYYHNYRNDLKKVVCDTDDEFALQIRKSVNDMPRYKMANNAEYFELLFQLLEKGGEIAAHAWKLLKLIATNPTMYWKVSDLDQIYKKDNNVQQISDKINWDDIFDSSSIYKMLYQLQILESFLEQYQDNQSNDRCWIQRFLELDGFQQILALFQKSTDLLSGKSADNLNRFEKIFMESMLRLIKIFMISAFSQSQAGNSIDVMELVKKGSNNASIEETIQTQNNQNVNGNDQTYNTPLKQVKPLAQIHIQQRNLQKDFNENDLNEDTIFGDQNKIKNESIQNQSEFFQSSSQFMHEDTAVQANNDQKDIQKFSQLVGVMQRTGIYETILAKINFSELQNQVLEIVCIMLNKKEVGQDDLIIIENALSLWVASVLQQQNLIDEFYEYKRSDEKAGKYGIKNAEEFVLAGLYCYKKEFETGSFDACELLKSLVEKMKIHECKEKKGSYLEDKILIGYMDSIKKLISQLNLSQKSEMLKVLSNSLFLHELFYECLFYDPNLTTSPNQNKCKTKEARASCFALLTKYIECMDPKQLDALLNSYLWPLLKQVKKPKKWQYVAQESVKSQFVGIQNLGSICYMNAMLQQFFMIPAFRYQLLKAIDTSLPDIREYKGLKIDDSMVRQLQKLFGYLELSERQAYDPTEFCFSFKDMDGNPTNTALQQDAQEFLSIFFDRVEQYLKPTTQKHLLQDVFGFKLCSQLICQSCGNIRNLLESQYTLQLQVKDRKGVEDSLAKMIEGSIINDYRCEACNQKVDVFKRNLIADMPNVLILHLQRMVFNFDTFENDKINSRFEFPPILRLADYSFKNVMKNENRITGQLLEQPEIKALMDISDEEYTYKLVGVTLHIGTAGHGHYYSLINTKRGNEEVEEDKPEWLQTERDPWRQFEDDKVTQYLYSNLKMDSFGGCHQSNMSDNEMNAYLTSSSGGSFGKNAYMLIYERMKKKQIRQETLEDLQNSSNTAAASLECINTATSRAAQGSTTPAADSQFANFRKVTSYVPSWIKDLVNEDNSTNLVDVHIYHENFFNLVKNVLKHISDSVLLTQHRYDLDMVPTFQRIKRNSLKITNKMMFDVLAYCFHNTQMSSITSSFGSLIQYCDSYYSIQKGDDSLLLEFINETFLQDNCQHFFNIMFNCTDNTSRLYSGRIATLVINKAFQVCNQSEDKQYPKIKELQEAAEKFLYTCVISLHTSECMKSWSRLQSFLCAIQEIGMGGPLQSHYLLTKFDIVVDLIDFMLGNRSPKALERGEKRPNMGVGQNIPPFEPLVILLSYLIRFSLTDQMKNERKEWDDRFNPAPSTLIGYKAPSQIEGNEDEWVDEYPLSETAYNFFTYQEFIDKVLREGYECEEFGKALAHFCYKNEQFSRRVCKFLIKGISKNDIDRVKNYLDVVTQVSLIKDGLQRMRLEWVFGIGLLNSQSDYSSVQFDDGSYRHQNQTKLGIQTLHYITGEVFSFKSTLEKMDQDDALLNLLWRYKGRIDTYTVNCLLSLVRLLTLDDSIAEYFSCLPGPTYCYARYTDWIKPYLHEQLADARKGYHGSLSQSKEEQVISVLSLYEKYEAFLRQKDKVTTENSVNIQESKQQQEEGELIIINRKQEQQVDYDQYKELNGSEIDDGGNDADDDEDEIIQSQDNEEENVRNLINNDESTTDKIRVTKAAVVAEERKEVESDGQNRSTANVIHCEPRPYVIIECVGTTKTTSETFQNVELCISQLACKYTMSYPTGFGNLSIPSKALKRPNMNVTSIGRTVINNSRSVEQQMQNRCLGSQFDSSRIQKGRQRYNDNDTAGQESQTTAADIQEVQPLIKPKMMNDDNSQWENINKRGDHQDEEQIDNYSDEADKMARNSDPDNDSNYQEDEGHYDINAIPGDINDEITPITDKYQNQHQEGTTQSCQIQVVEQNDDSDIYRDQKHDSTQPNDSNGLNIIEENSDLSQISWPYGVNTCNDLAYKFYVINHQNITIKCVLKFKEPSEDNQQWHQDSGINLHWPRAGIKTIVYPHQTKTMIVIPKIIPTNDNQVNSANYQPNMEINKLKIDLYWSESKRNVINSNNNRASIYPISGLNDIQQQRRPGIMINTSNVGGSATTAGVRMNLNLNNNETEGKQVYEQETGIPIQEESNDEEANENPPPLVELPPAPSGQKRCPQCTLFNDADNYICDVCEFTFPSS